MLTQNVFSLLGGAAGVALISGTLLVIQGWIKDRRDRLHRIDDDEGAQLVRMKAAAEKHLIEYDVPMRELAMRYERAINELRVKVGWDPMEFPPLPSLVPLLQSLETPGMEAAK